ncbi:hypothetical protein OIU84_016284 [Salix udensis]|uniref:NAC domain-containing protein n=1 Tax=Salix udensis TaxID=889485 RepID=A0AAD6NQ76_9ROSI|nr:hypothetical protein OIU84_016284 [Salix udensis]
MDFQPSRVGYGFHPTDEELVDYYLRLKMHGGYEQDVSLIEVVNVCDYEPWALPGLLGNQDPNDPECYFFSPRSYKYANSDRANRKTEGGFWKVTGKDRTDQLDHARVPSNFSASITRGISFSAKLKKDPEAIMPAYEEECGYGAPMPSYFTADEQDEYSYEIQHQLNSFRDDDGTGDYNLDAAMQYRYGNM